MANKAIFSKTIIDTDAFLEMPATTQNLYFHLNMHADDDGFIGNPKRIGRMIGASDDDFKILIAKKFIIVFESGVIVIKHWRIHNTLSKMRYKETSYLDEKSQLLIKENNAYSLDEGKPLDDSRLVEMGKRQVRRTVDEQETNLSKDKLSKDKTSKDKLSKDKTSKDKLSEDNPSKKKSAKADLNGMIDSFTENEELREALKAFLDMRKSIKKPIQTEYAFKLALNKLKQLSDIDSIRIEIVNQSVEHNWRTFYTLQNSYKTNEVEMPEYMKKQEKGDIVSTPVNEETLAKALELQRQFKGK